MQSRGETVSRRTAWAVPGTKTTPRETKTPRRRPPAGHAEKIHKNSLPFCVTFDRRRARILARSCGDLSVTQGKEGNLRNKFSAFRGGAGAFGRTFFLVGGFRPFLAVNAHHKAQCPAGLRHCCGQSTGQHIEPVGIGGVVNAVPSGPTGKGQAFQQEVINAADGR